jgi:hypothetical protein
MGFLRRIYRRMLDGEVGPWPSDTDRAGAHAYPQLTRQLVALLPKDPMADSIGS